MLGEGNANVINDAGDIFGVSDPFADGAGDLVKAAVIGRVKQIGPNIKVVKLGRDAILTGDHQKAFLAEGAGQLEVKLYFGDGGDQFAQVHGLSLNRPISFGRAGCH